MTGWQPIETVPKDGTKILVGRFVRGCSYGKNGYIVADYWRVSARATGYQGFGKFNSQFWPATHWMPLPPPELEP